MRTVLVAAACVALLGACGSNNAATSDGPRIVVTTSILGDVVAHLVGDDASVEVLIPPGADPHDFAISVRHAQGMRDAAVVVRNGLGLEAGLDDSIDAAAADDATVLTATDYVETLPFGAPPDRDQHNSGDENADASDLHDQPSGNDHASKAAHGHGEEATAAASADHAGHDHSGDDPHVFTDPVRMAEIARGLAADLADEIPELRSTEAQRRAEAYVGQLEALDTEVARILRLIPDERRVLVTNHEVFGYFADRYGFEVLGAVVPGGSTLAEPSASALAKLIDELEDRDVPAIFVETSASKRVAEALAAEGADVELVELFSESLGEPSSEADTYIDMMRTNARRVAEALRPSR